jgi:hypothetical protein
MPVRRGAVAQEVKALDMRSEGLESYRHYFFVENSILVVVSPRGSCQKCHKKLSNNTSKTMLFDEKTCYTGKNVLKIHGLY